MTINELYDLIIDNKDWLFSGLGLVVLGGLYKIFRLFRSNPNNSAVSEAYIREMDLLVSPLYAKIGDNTIFMKGSPGNIDSRRQRDQTYFKFWGDIKKYMYLGSDDLQKKLKEYFKNKTATIGDRSDESYEEAEKQLINSIKNRHKELEIKIKP